MTSIEGKNVPNKDVIVVKHQKGEVIRLGPVRMDILEDGSNTDQRLGAANITIPPKTAGPPQHWHQVSFPALSLSYHTSNFTQMHDEAFLILSGTVTFTSRDQQVVLTTGDYIVVPPMAPQYVSILLYSTKTSEINHQQHFCE
jgi:mannose-6-phosphate isomerase-like protein (cupin superfamily)